MMKDFQAFTTTFSGKSNVLYNKVGISPAFDPNDSQASKPSPKEALAIWDTGASCTLITKKKAIEIGLIPTGKTTVNGVNNSTLENTYIVNIYLPSKVGISFVKIAEVPQIAGGGEVLIGMDIIGAGDFSVYNENGKTVMSYRIPSLGGMNFVTEADRVRSQNAIIQKIEAQKSNRRPFSEKERQKRKQARKNKKKHRR